MRYLIRGGLNQRASQLVPPCFVIDWRRSMCW